MYIYENCWKMSCAVDIYEVLVIPRYAVTACETDHYILVVFVVMSKEESVGIWPLILIRGLAWGLGFPAFSGQPPNFV